jgi:hypothetical protein
MALRGRVCGLALALATMGFGPAVVAQQAATCPPSEPQPADGPFIGIVRGDLPQPPCAERSLPPATHPPLAGVNSDAMAPAGVPAVADLHVASTDLGFDRGIGPAPGGTIGYRGQAYLVVEVAARDGSPTFSGGSRFVITTKGGALEVGLKAMDGRDRQVAAASVR